MPLPPLWAREGFDSPEAYAESLTPPAPTTAPAPAPVSAPRSVNKIDAKIARDYLRSMGFDPTGLNAQQLADKLHQITPSEYYEITGWTPDVTAAAPQAPAATPAAPAATPASVATTPAEEQPAIVDEVGSLDPASKVAKRQQGFEPVYNPMNYPLPGDKGGFSLGQIFGAVLAVASLAVPGIGEVVGAAILEAVGITGASSAVTAGVGAASLSAASTAAQGGSVEDVLKAGVSAGVASGLNVGVGGGVPGAVAGSAAGTVIKGGDVDQVITNALAAGVGAGVQGALPDNPDSGKIIGTAARTYIATGGNVDQTLLNTAVTAIGTLDQPDKSAQQLQAASKPASDTAAQETAAREVESVTQSDAARQQELADYQEKLNQYAIDKAIYEQTYGPIADQPPSAAPAAAPAAETTLAPQTIAATTPAVSPVVTDLDLVKKVAAQPTQTVDPKTLEQVIVQGQKDTANAAPVETGITTPRPDTTQGLPALEKVTVSGQRDLVDPFVDISPPAPETTPASTTGPSLDKVTVTGQRDLVDPFVDIAPSPAKTTPELNRVTVTGQRDLVDPFVDIAPPPELEKVTVTGTRDLVDPFVDIAPPPELEKVTVTGKSELPPTPPDLLPVSPDVKAEEPKKEEPKKEDKKTYPTVTSVPPPKKPGRQPIITGASPARLLADALAAYRPAGAIEGEETGKQRQNVWNEKSLRLKDALGL